MKEIIAVIDQDQTYSKMFCAKASKLLGTKYNFINFSNLTNLKKYVSENQTESAILSENFVDNIDDLSVNSIYILEEKEKLVRKEGKKTFLYKLQNINKPLEYIDQEISERHKNNKSLISGNKLILFYSPDYINNKFEIIKKIAKYLQKKSKVLIVDIDEFNNYKGNVGLSNIIFNYKEKTLSDSSITKEITTDKDLDFISSITYPEDFNVISNIDISNIINEIRKLNYEYIFVNADTSFVKCQYIINDCNNLILLNDKKSNRVDKLKNYLKTENHIDFKKIIELDLSKFDKAYLQAFVKQCFDYEK